LLRIADLNGVLADYACPKNARKEDLQKRLLDLLKSRDITEHQKTQLRTAVENSYSKM
jgi:hypothetical protein